LSVRTNVEVIKTRRRICSCEQGRLKVNRNSIHVLCMAFFLSGSLSGCASVADNATVPAFADAVHSAGTSFSATRNQEAADYSGFALRSALLTGRVHSVDCGRDQSPTGIEQARHCRIVSTEGLPLMQGAAGPNVAALMQALTDYSSALRDLAACSDLQERSAALQHLSASAGTIAAAAGVPAVAAIGALLTDIETQIALNHRRQELARITAAFDPLIGDAADALQKEMVLLQQNIVLAKSQDVFDADQKLLSASVAHTGDVYDLARNLARLTNAEQSAASVTFDFAVLKTAHHSMTVSLQKSGSVSISAVISQLETFAADAQAVDDALTGKAMS
jgi:hypothetical protein